MRRHGIAGLPLALALGALMLPAQAGAVATPEAQVKAAYLYKLASFVRWPDGATRDSPFRVCVSGRSDIASVLEELVRGHDVAGQSIAVQQLSSSQAELAKACRVLFLGRGADSARSFLAATDGLPVLTVSDRDNGTRGGVVEFLIRDGRVRFAIDRRLASARRLELSSKLMDVAVAVRG